jgi:hypothetical protein
MNTPRIVIVGAAGEMAAVGVERFCARSLVHSLHLYDLNKARLEQIASKLPPERTSIDTLDLFDPDALRAAIQGAALVVLGAGPYIRTAAPVMRACIDARVNYLDFDDDVESTQEALRLNAEAKSAGIALLVGCGASPGMSNMMAVEAAAQLEDITSIDICFVTGDEGPRPYGAAVLEHILHITAGDCLVWRDGKQVAVPAVSESEIFPIGGSIGDFRLYVVAHPEAITLPLHYPQVRSIRVMGGFYPQPVNGATQGIARAVHQGKLTVPEAVEWFNETLQDRTGPAKGWRYSLAGMFGQVRRKESSLAALSRYLWKGVRKQHMPYSGGLLVRAVGTRAGEPSTVIIRTPTGGPDSFIGSSIAAITGTCIAAFTALAIENMGKFQGVLMPEDWVEPSLFYSELERIGVPRHELVERRVLGQGESL